MIKTLLCVVFAAVSMTFSAQKYEFNYLLEYSGVTAKHLYFINSKDCSYQLSLYNSSDRKLYCGTTGMIYSITTAILRLVKKVH